MNSGVMTALSSFLWSFCVVVLSGITTVLGGVVVGFLEAWAGSSVMSLTPEVPALREQPQALVLVLGRLHVAPGFGYSSACLHPCRDGLPLYQKCLKVGF